MELAPGILPAFGDFVRLDDVEADRRLFRVHGKGAVELLDALREDVQEKRELRLSPDNDVPR